MYMQTFRLIFYRTGGSTLREYGISRFFAAMTLTHTKLTRSLSPGDIPQTNVKALESTVILL